MRRIVCHDTRFTLAHLWLILIIMARLTFGLVLFKICQQNADSADDFDQLDVDHTSKDTPTIHQKIVSKAEKKFWNLDA